MSTKFLSNICNKSLNKGVGDGKCGMDTVRLMNNLLGEASQPASTRNDPVEGSS